jgi:hypothetical protein
MAIPTTPLGISGIPALAVEILLAMLQHSRVFGKPTQVSLT